MYLHYQRDELCDVSFKLSSQRVDQPLYNHHDGILKGSVGSFVPELDDQLNDVVCIGLYVNTDNLKVKYYITEKTYKFLKLALLHGSLCLHINEYRHLKI